MPERYVYFMPDADGPCRFGMYNKLQRLVLDRFEDFREIPIVYLSWKIPMPPTVLSLPSAPRFSASWVMAVIIADVLDRTVWRVRPYERRAGMTDAVMTEALQRMATEIEVSGAAWNSISFCSFWKRSLPRLAPSSIRGSRADRASGLWAKSICAPIPIPIKISSGSSKPSVGKCGTLRWVNGSITFPSNGPASSAAAA